jgi:uncharacterized protein YbaR (Trm112 family)
MISPELLAILCCPESHQALRFADDRTLQEINQRIGSGTLHNRAGKPIKAALTGGLIREDEALLYPIHNDLPILLVNEAIVLKTSPATPRHP